MNFSQQFSQIQNSVIRVLAIKINGANQINVSSGTGVLIGDGKRAITCSHCIIAGTLTVCAVSGQNSGQIATVIFNDPNLDIAILEFPNSLGIGTPIGDSTAVNIGQEAFVAGFPSYSSEITALFAHIAGFELDKQHNKLIKIDSSVNHGNSGGPLFNSNGELIGIVNSKFGSISDFLTQIEQANPQAAISIGGINPVEAIKELIRAMKKNLNLGVGTAIPTHVISNYTNYVKDLIITSV